MGLTNKQEMFSQQVVKKDSQSDAYRIAYNVENMTDKQIHEEACKLAKNPKVSQRIKEIKEAISKRRIYNIGKSIKRDLELIEKYEALLKILSNPESTDDEVNVATRTIRFIGNKAYNSAQDRLSKQHGFFGEHNHQKNASLSDEARESRIRELKNKLFNKDTPES